MRDLSLLGERLGEHMEHSGAIVRVVYWSPAHALLIKPGHAWACEWHTFA